MPKKKLGLVCVAEDTDHLRDVIVRAIREEGFLVVGAEDGQKALDLIRASSGPYLALVSDLDMPRVNGDSLIREIEKSPITFSAYILISGHSKDHPTIKALISSCTRVPLYVLSKPFEKQELSELLDKIISLSLSPQQRRY